MTEARYCSSSPYFSSLGHFTVNEKIDICRGLFAFLVVGAHAVDISWVIHPEVPGQLSGWLHDLLLYVAAAGVYWVIGFFVISGYCIQLSVERLIQGNAFSLRDYLIARTRDSASLLSGTSPHRGHRALDSLFATILLGARGIAWRSVAQLFVVQNLTQTYGSFAPSWSITNEMFYYVFLRPPWSTWRCGAASVRRSWA